MLFQQNEHGESNIKYYPFDRACAPDALLPVLLFKVLIGVKEIMHVHELDDTSSIIQLQDISARKQLCTLYILSFRQENKGLGTRLCNIKIR